MLKRSVVYGITAAAGPVLTQSGPVGTGITVNDVLSLFNIFVGVMLALAILLFIGGLIVWLSLLGLVIREIGIRLMEWAVVIVFVLTVLLAIEQFFVGNPAATTFAIAIIVALIIGFVVIQVIKDTGGGEVKKPERR